MIQRTLLVDGIPVYCYEDGSVEWKAKAGCFGDRLYKTFGSKQLDGYLAVVIGGKHYRVHRLIALAFHSNVDNLPEIDHINRDPLDNRPCNLRWASRSDNSSNRKMVEDSLSRWGFRPKDDRKRYNKVYKESHPAIHVVKPDGKTTRYYFSSVDDPIYKMLKALPPKERYYKYKEIKNDRNK